MALDAYMQQVQRFIRDAGQEFVNADNIRVYVNRARRELALRTQSIRILSPISGQIGAINITNPGTGYVDPILTITAPDFPAGTVVNPSGVQATALAQQIGGQITNASITNAGAGYVSPGITITDANNGPGTGATATITTTPLSQTQNNQEIYNVKDIPLTNFPGVGEVFWVNSLSIIYAAYRYRMMTYSFSTYQAMIRNYPKQYLYVPSVCAQLGQGTNASIYMYPVPSAAYQLEFDCFCLPMDMEDDQTPEALPGPWTDCVPYFAAHLAYLEMQNLNAANYYFTLFEKMADNYSSFARPRKTSNPYGRWIAFLPMATAAFEVARHFFGPLVI